MAIRQVYAGSSLERNQVDAFVPQVWTEGIQEYRQSAFFMEQTIQTMNVVGKKGDTFHIPKVGIAGVNDRIPNQPVEFQTRTASAYTVMLDSDKESSFGIDDLVEIQSQYNQMAIYTKAAGRAMARDLDNALLALRASVPTDYHIYNTTGAGAGTAAGDPASLNEATLIASMQKMLERDVPLTECKWILSPNQFLDLMQLELIKNSDYSISSGLMPANTPKEGMLGTLYGMPVCVSNQIKNNSLDGYIPREGAAGQPTPGVVGSPYLPKQDALVGTGLARGKTGSEVAQPFQTGMLVHPEWGYLLKQKNFTVDSAWLTLYQTNALVTRQVYGSKLYRDDHAVLIFSQGS